MPQSNMHSERREGSKDTDVQRKSNEAQEDSYLQDQEISLNGNLPWQPLMLECWIPEPGEDPFLKHHTVTVSCGVCKALAY